MGYTRETIKGVSWLGAFRVFSRVLSFLRTIIVARILTPSQFGVFGIATLILAFIEIMTETGVNVFLVQNKDSINKYLDTAWIVSIIRGFLITGAILIIAPFVSKFFRSQESFPLLILVSIVPLFRGFINPAIAAFQKDLHFHKEFYYRSSIFFVETFVSILLVLTFKNPSALVLGMVVGALFEVIISFAFLSQKPRVSFNSKIFRQIASSGKWVTVAGVFGYLSQNGDNVVVGRILGTGSLGIYDMMYSISTLPISEISDIVARVTFPVYVKIADDKERLRRAYIKTTIISAIFILPLIAVFLLFPEQLILLFLGPKWLGGTQVLQVLSIFAILAALTSPSGSIFYSVKQQKYVTIITVVGTLVMFSLIIPLIKAFGLVGAGLSVLLASIVQVPIIFFYLKKIFTHKVSVN